MNNCDGTAEDLQVRIPNISNHYQVTTCYMYVTAITFFNYIAEGQSVLNLHSVYDTVPVTRQVHVTTVPGQRGLETSASHEKRLVLTIR